MHLSNDFVHDFGIKRGHMCCYQVYEKQPIQDLLVPAHLEQVGHYE